MSPYGALAVPQGGEATKKFEVGCKLGTRIESAVGQEFLTTVPKLGKGTQFRDRSGDSLGLIHFFLA
jgi:hypothetical protein